MKKKIKTVDSNGNKTEKEISYIPARYILAILLAVMETLMVLALVILLGIFVPYFYILIFLTQIGVVLSIIGSKDNPDYKIPWLLFVLILPVAGFMIYFMFYKRKLSKRLLERLNMFEDISYKEDTAELLELQKEDEYAYRQALEIRTLSGTHIYQNTEMRYFSSGEEMHKQMLIDLGKAQQFIFLEYFIIEEGVFWNSILAILKQKAANGIDVKLVYDDIGCMTTLPGNYDKILKSFGIDAVIFSKLRGQADNEFNNRSHRKIMVIDGSIAYTGGINLADEYINLKQRFGHWKDIGIRLSGEATVELTRLFLLDYSLNSKKVPDASCYLKATDMPSSGFVVPFGDGPNPVYTHRVAKTIILNMLYQAKRYVYITTPYLIIDSELQQAIENSALRGIDIRIIVPHIPDKKVVFAMTKSHYKQFIDCGVKIYEYTPGFIHAKSYLSDDSYAMLGTINLDYRSLVHHFENGVWIYNSSVIQDIKKDFLDTQSKSFQINREAIRDTALKRILRSVVRIFSPLL